MSATASSESPFPGLSVRRLISADAVACVPLSAEAGWNQSEADWRFMIEAGEGIGLVAADRLVATTLALPFAALPSQPAIGWISMVLVTRAFRGRGLATWMMRWAIDALRSRGVTPVLDATPAGREVYARLGFCDGETLLRMRGDGCVGEAAALSIVALGESDMPALLSLDQCGFGAERGKLLRYLAGAAPDLALVAQGRAGIDGFLLARPGRTATQLGPIGAARPDIALALVDAALARLPKAPVLIDAFAEQPAFCAGLRERCFIEERRFTRMHLGDVPKAASFLTFAAAGPELG
jgi:GNAT superfamily N-acetyltransferase